MKLMLSLFLVFSTFFENVLLASPVVKIEVVRWDDDTDGMFLSWIGKNVENDNLPDKATLEIIEKFHERVADGLNRTLLHWAARLGATKLCKYLLEGSNRKKYRQLVNSTTKTAAETPLHYAVMGNQTKLVRLLVRYGANMEATRFDGKTALSLANDVKTASLLVQLGANYLHRDLKGSMPIHLAVERRNRALYDYYSSLMRSSQTTDCPAEICPWPAGLSYQSSLDFSLRESASKGELELVRSLLDEGANLEAKNSDGWTSLHYAAQNGQLEIVRLLLDRGADLETKNTDGWTSLHWAADTGHMEVVRLLLDRGANVNAISDAGKTPLMLAVFGNKLDVVKLLVDRGADIQLNQNLKPWWSGSCDSSTPLACAIIRGYTEIAEYLKSKGAF